MNPISASTPPYTISALPSTSPTLLPTCLSLFDESIAWLTSKGLSAQWGSEPLQDDEKTIARMKRIIEQCEFLVATSHSDNKILGLVAYSSERSHPEFIPAAEEPELYLWFLIASRSDPRAKGVGKTLVEKCEQEARESGVGLLRVDCFDGDVANGALVRVYEGMRFRRLGSRYNVKGWVGQVLGKRLEGVGGSRR